MRRIVFALASACCLMALFSATGFAAPSAQMRGQAAPARAAHQPVGKVLYSAHQQLQSRQIGVGGHAAPFGSGDLAYNDGPIATDVQIYVIFWGHAWVDNSTGQVNSTGQLILSYFNDVGGTPFENILHQYYDTSTHIPASAQLAGYGVEAFLPATTTACGGTTVDDSLIAPTVKDMIIRNNWPGNSTDTIYFVYTPVGYYVGFANNGTEVCSEKNFCAYHSFSSAINDSVPYVTMPYPIDLSSSGCPALATPNGDGVADSLINISSVEQFGTITDPLPCSPITRNCNGWVDAAGFEIGDKCTDDYSANTTLNNGGVFALQTEYSNATHTCVNAFTTPAHWPSTGGVFRPSNGTLYLKLANSTGFADLQLAYGQAGDKPVVGDWTAKGYKSIGVYRGNVFYLRNSNTTGYADIVFAFGTGNVVPLAGDWNGDGTDTIGVYDPSTSTFYLRNSNTTGFADIVVTFGESGDIPVVGDWSGDGVDTIGVYRPSTGTFYLSNSNTSPAADYIAQFGPLGAHPVVGDWNGDGTDTIGVTTNGRFLLRNTNSSGSSDLSYALGVATDIPIAGLWIA